MTLKNYLLVLGLSLLAISSCVSIADNSGKASYKRHCASCHGAEGEGLGNYIPPLKNADYLKEHELELACIIKYGLKGEIQVNGVSYSQPMGGIAQMDNAEVTNLINYIRKEFLDKKKKLRLQEVGEQLAACE